MKEPLDKLNDNEQLIFNFIEMNTDIPCNMFVKMLEYSLKRTSEDSSYHKRLMIEAGRGYGIHLAYRFLDLEDSFDTYWLGAKSVFSGLQFGDIWKSETHCRNNNWRLHLEMNCQYEHSLPKNLRCHFCHGLVLGIIQAYADDEPRLAEYDSSQPNDTENCDFSVYFSHSDPS